MSSYIGELEVELNHGNEWFILKKMATNEQIRIQICSTTITTALSDQNHKGKLLDYINNSQISIKLSGFLFNDVDIADALIDASKRKVAIFVLTGIIDRNLRKDYGFPDNQVNQHIGVLQKLEKTSVNLRCGEGIHAKFWVIDDNIGVITSANLTINSLTKVPEIGMIVSDSASINQLNYYFNKLWVRFCDKEMESGQLVFLPKYPEIDIKMLSKVGQFVQYVKMEKHGFSWKDSKWFTEFHCLAESANQEIIVTSFDLRLDKTKLLNILEHKLQENVNVILVISEHAFTRSKGEGIRKITSRFMADYPNHFTIKVHENNHTKILMVDKSKILLSTKNYESEKQFKQSFELGIRMDDHYPIMQDVINRLISESNDVLITSDQPEYQQYLMEKYGCSPYLNNITIWIWEVEKPVFGYLGESLTMDQLKTEIETADYLLLYKMKEPKYWVLSIKFYLKLELSINSDGFWLLRWIDESDKFIPDDEISEKYLLVSNSIKFRQYVSV